MLLFEQKYQTDNERLVIVQCEESCRLERNVFLNKKPFMSDHIVKLYLALFQLLHVHVVFNQSLILERKNTFFVERATKIVQIYQLFILIDRI